MAINIKYRYIITIKGVKKDNTSPDYKSKQFSTLYCTNPQQVTHTFRRQTVRLLEK